MKKNHFLTTLRSIWKKQLKGERLSGKFQYSEAVTAINYFSLTRQLAFLVNNYNALFKDI